MNGLLIRVLSTGKTGTKFLANLFADQGYPSYHEDLYFGEPYSATTLYLSMLGDLWKQDRAAYYALQSDFAKPYVRTVAEHLEANRTNKTPKRWRAVIGGEKENEKRGHVIHTAHNLTPATPLIERELEKTGLQSRNLILFRNPLKTIHAIYLVEGKFREDQAAYRMRSPSFSDGDEGFIGAANVWANLYRMAVDQRRHFGQEKFRVVELEQFSTDLNYASQIFEFTGLSFDAQRFQRFSRQELAKPLRAAKVDSARNSHLFHNPDFVFSEKQISDIKVQIDDVFQDYGINWDLSVQDYMDFHTREKARLGFG